MNVNSKRAPAIFIFLFAVTILINVLYTACSSSKSGSNSGGQGNGNPPSLPQQIAASLIQDIDGDGDKDIILSSQKAGFSSLLALINQGHGESFTKNTSIFPIQYKGTDGAAVDIQAADINKDGHIDIIVSVVDVNPFTFYGSSQIQIYIGNGAGQFTDASSQIDNGHSPTPMSGPQNCVPSYTWFERVRVADLNGDGAPELVLTSPSQCGGILLLNNGSGTFTTVSPKITYNGTTNTYGSLAMADMNGSARRSISDVLIGDVNNDGKLDLIAPSYSTGNANSTFLNTTIDSTLSFTLVSSTSPHSIFNGVALDINKDGYLDVLGSMALSFSPTGTVPVTTLQGNGTGSFTENNLLLEPQPTVFHARMFLTDDFNKDGAADVFIADHGYDGGNFPGARNWLLLNNGTGKLVDKTAANMGISNGYTHQASSGDFTGDGYPDLFLNNNSNCDGTYLACSNEPRFWKNNGSGSFIHYEPTIN